jgi:hypothetical protein
MKEKFPTASEAKKRGKVKSQTMCWKITAQLSIYFLSDGFRHRQILSQFLLN